MSKQKPGLWLLAPLLGSLLLVAGCSKVKILYDHAGFFLLPRLESYAPFKKSQKAAIESEFNAYMKWHRVNMLPRYAAYARELGTALAEPVAFDAKKARTLRAKMMVLYFDTLRPALGAVARVLATLDDNQINALDSRFEHDDKDFRARYASGTPEAAAKEIDRREDNLLNGVEFFAGRLSRSQRDRIRAASRHVPFSGDVWLDARHAWRVGLIARLRNHTGARDVEAYLGAWVLRRDSMLTEPQRKAVAAFEAASDQLFADIVHIVDPEEITRCRDLLEDFARDFDELSAET